MVALHLHDTRKPFPEEHGSRPHEKPRDPYWEETLKAYGQVQNAAQAAFVLVLATMTRSRVVMSFVNQLLLQSPEVDETADLVQKFDWAAVRSAPQM